MKHELIKGTAVRVKNINTQQETVTGYYSAIIVSDIQIIVKPGGYTTPCVTVLRSDSVYVVVDINNCSLDDTIISDVSTDLHLD